MVSNSTKFWLGLGVGSIIGVVACHCCCSERGKRLKEKMMCALNHAAEESKCMMHSTKEKAMDLGEKAADKMADTAYNVAEKADEMKNKIHGFNDSMK